MDQQMDKPDFLRDTSNSMNLLLHAMFAVSRTVQIFSRSQTGGWFFGYHLPIGLFLQAFFYQIRVSATGRFDVVPFRLVFLATCCVLAMQNIRRSYCRYKGQQRHSYDPGIGNLSWFRIYAHWKPSSINLASDLFVAGGLSVVFRFFGSPCQSDWYALTVLRLLAVHFWLVVRDQIQVQHHIDATIESRAWSKKTKRSH